MARTVPERWRVAFSLAGEQRELVRAVALEVERQLGEGTVFYDEWYEAYIAGADADIVLQDIYGQRCDLAVICVSSHYDDKPWTQAEWRAVRARRMQADKSDEGRLGVLAVRVGDGEVDGIHFNEIVPDIRSRGAAGGAQLILDRLQHLGLGSTAATPAAVAMQGWPAAPPPFTWPIADHSEAQQAFGDLLVAGSAHRVLLVQGVSETGKSHLATQMERNVVESLAELRCAKFNFKGSTDRQFEFDAFATRLGVGGLDSPDLRAQMNEVVAQLEGTKRPTVLILDTYEHAGEGEAWVERVLLPKLLRADWLRVVVLGQRVPARQDTLWASIAAPTVTLTLPDPQDWLAYARQCRPDEGGIDLEFVTRAHEMSGGKPAILAGLLGPK